MEPLTNDYLFVETDGTEDESGQEPIADDYMQVDELSDPIIELIKDGDMEAETESIDDDLPDPIFEEVDCAEVKTINKNDEKKLPGKRFECKICDNVFSDESSLNRHVTIIHNQICKSLNLEPLEYIDELTRQRRLQCRNCMVDFKQTNTFNNHFKMHPCKCPDGNCCPGEIKSKEFELCKCIDTTRITLCSYQESLSFQKYVCANCFRVYNRERDFRRHIIAHNCICAERLIPVENSTAKCCRFEIKVTENDTYQCPNCNEEFDLIVSIIEHLKQHECVCGTGNCIMPFPEFEYKYPCPSCPKGFYLKKSLVKHQVVHINGKCGHLKREPLEVKDEATGGKFFDSIKKKSLANCDESKN